MFNLLPFCSDFFECYKCQNKHFARFLWIMANIVFIALIAWIISIYNRNKDKRRQMTMPIVRIMITHLQLFSILSGLETFTVSKQSTIFHAMINIRAILLTPAETLFDF